MANEIPAIETPGEEAALRRLEQSRRALAERMNRKRRREQDRDAAAYQAIHAQEAGGSAQSGGGWFTAKRAFRTWWYHHPLSVATDMAQPALARFARERPLKLLGYALAAGAAVAVLRPWRIIPLTAVLAATLRTSDLTAVTASLMAPDHSPPHKE